MEWVLWMIAVGVLGLAAVAASGRLGELPGTVTDTPRPHVPTGAVTGDDLRALRFAVVPRGYSMDQVDGLLDRLARQLDATATVREPASVVPAPSAAFYARPPAVGDDERPAAAAGPATNGATESASSQPEPETSRTPPEPDDERPAFFRPAGEGDPRR